MEQAVSQSTDAAAQGGSEPPKGNGQSWAKRNPGLLSALPTIIFLFVFFVAPLILVAIYSVQEPYQFELGSQLSFLNYKDFITEGYYTTLGWSVLIAVLTTIIAFIVGYPCAYGMVKVFPKMNMWITLLIVMPIFVTSNIRLFGWTLILIKGGFLNYLTTWIPGLEGFEFLYNVPVIILGMVYIYFPFMVFPLVLGLEMLDDSAVEAAIDLGANRWQVLKEVEMPMAAAGIFIGALLVFVLSLGAMVEAQVLGGNVITPFADDIHHAFSYQQNWPLGSALSVILLAITVVLIVVVMRYVDLDKLLGTRAKLG